MSKPQFIIKFDSRRDERLAVDKLQSQIGESVIHSGEQYAITNEQKARLEKARLSFRLIKEL